MLPPVLPLPGRRKRRIVKETGEMNSCAVCAGEAPAGKKLCSRCQPLIPPSLLQACTPVGGRGYCVGLEDGTQIPFDWATVDGGWVTLGSKGGFDRGSFGHSFPAGIDIRLDVIVWCAEDLDGQVPGDGRA